jgi:hypothetical protein
MRALRGGIWCAVVVVGMLMAPAAASAALTFTNVPSVSEVRSGEPVTFTMTVGNTGPDTEDISVGSIELRMGGEKSVNNPVESVSSTHGPCAVDPVSGGYHGVTCQLSVPAGQSATITEVVRINESMDNFAGVLESNGAIGGPADTGRVQAIYPPRFLEDSNKIKVKGLPAGCVDDRDPTVTVTAKGAKKITAALAGPYDEWHGRLFGAGFSGKIGSEKGKKLKLEVPLERERAGFYDLKLAAKYDNKPKQKTEINIQRCGIPDG